jgi:diaminopropionate ammonia-lyase
MEIGDGEPHRVHAELETIMAGLACGLPSQIAWEILRDQASAFIICPDEIAKRGMRVLGSPIEGDNRIVSGESGAVTLGLVFELLVNSTHKYLRDKLNLNNDSRVLLFSTEGDTDPGYYRQVVWGIA